MLTSSTSTAGSGGNTTSTSSTTSTGNGGDGGTQMAGVGGATTTTGAGGAPMGYPAGPYGNKVDEVFPFLTWEGYLSTDPLALATTETWTDPYTALDLHGSGAQYALIHTALSG